MITATKEKISISKTEYLRLKKIDEYFKGFLTYFEHLMDIKQAREEVKKRKIISQEDLFKKLGF